MSCSGKSQYEDLYKKLKDNVSASLPDMAITFDLWRDRQARGYLRGTGYSFSDKLSLRCVENGTQYFPKIVEGYMASKTRGTVAEMLHTISGQSCKVHFDTASLRFGLLLDHLWVLLDGLVCSNSLK